MEIFCKQLSKKSHYILHRGSTRQEEKKEAKKRKVPKEVTFDVAPWILDKGVETQVIKKSTRIKKHPEFFYKFIQVFTSMRIAPTREALHDHARKMKKKEEEEKNNEEEEEKNNKEEEEKNNEEEEEKNNVEEEEKDNEDKEEEDLKKEVQRLSRENSRLRARLAAAGLSCDDD